MAHNNFNSCLKNTDSYKEKEQLAPTVEFFLEDRQFHHLVIGPWILSAHADSSGPGSGKF